MMSKKLFQSKITSFTSKSVNCSVAQQCLKRKLSDRTAEQDMSHESKVLDIDDSESNTGTKKQHLDTSTTDAERSNISADRSFSGKDINSADTEKKYPEEDMSHANNKKSYAEAAVRGSSQATGHRNTKPNNKSIGHARSYNSNVNRDQDRKHLKMDTHSGYQHVSGHSDQFRSYGGNDDRHVKKNIESDKPKVSQTDDACFRGVPLEDLKRAPKCFRDNDVSLPPLKASSEHKVFFYVPPEGWKNATPIPYPQGSQDSWNDNYVYMPNNQKSELPGGKGTISRWEKITEALHRNIPGSFELQEAILSYNPHYKNRWNFDALHRYFEMVDEAKRVEFFTAILPKMTKLALQLPDICPKAVPILKQRTNMKITLSQQQIACLLANAFFCTFPRRNYKTKTSKLPDINFTALYSDQHHHRKFEKFHCIINYFRRVTQNMPVGTVTYARQYVCESEFNAKVDEEFTSLYVSTTGTIEDDGKGMLQADFANKFVGGGVLGHGLVQEEIRFLICPEMILSRLFTEVLTDNDVLIMTGCERFSNYEGYADTFKFSGDHIDRTESDEWGRKYTEVVAMDALVIRGFRSQFEKDKVFRELHKAYCAFKGNQFSAHLPAVCTGNWGCGAFGGDKQLKAIIQMMAAGAAGRDICYFTFGDAKLSGQLGEIYNILKADNLKIKNILDLVKLYSDKLNSYEGCDKCLFEFIADQMGRKFEKFAIQSISESSQDDSPDEDFEDGSLEINFKAETP